MFGYLFRISAFLRCFFSALFLLLFAGARAAAAVRGLFVVVRLSFVGSDEREDAWVNDAAVFDRDSPAVAEPVEPAAMNFSDGLAAGAHEGDVGGENLGLVRVGNNVTFAVENLVGRPGLEHRTEDLFLDRADAVASTIRDINLSAPAEQRSVGRCHCGAAVVSEDEGALERDETFGDNTVVVAVGFNVKGALDLEDQAFLDGELVGKRTRWTTTTEQ